MEIHDVEISVEKVNDYIVFEAKTETASLTITFKEGCSEEAEILIASLDEFINLAEEEINKLNS